MENSRYEKMRDEILDSPCTLFKTKAAIKAFDDMDCVKALKQAKLLVQLFDLKCRGMAQTTNGLASGLNEAGKYYLGITS